MCGICDIQNKDEPKEFTDKEVDEFILAVYAGTITVRSLDLATYLKVARKLSNGMYKGYGLQLMDVLYLSPDYKMLYALRTNVYVFSAAKQYHQVREMRDLLRSGDKITPFSEFKKGAKDVFERYNENYLKTEYNSAIAQGRSASQWQEIQANKLAAPYLKYQTAGDGRVRPEHAQLNGIVRLVDDKFWDLYMPPNDWNCRCDAVQITEGKETDISGLKPENVPEIFRMNAGKDKVVFSHKHPYFTVAKGDKSFAKTNFGLPLPKDVT